MRWRGVGGSGGFSGLRRAVGGSRERILCDAMGGERG